MRLFRIILIPLISLAANAQTAHAPEEPITSGERFSWVVSSTVGPATLTGGLISAGFGTLTDRPKEYGTHWDGYGQRYGMRLTGVATSNAMEAGIGALWGEDPRYYRAGSDMHFGSRVGHVVKWTFIAQNKNGTVRPAYARYIAISGNNFISNSWREQSEADTTHAVERIGLGVLARMAGNTFEEFWPDAKRKLFHRN